VDPTGHYSWSEFGSDAKWALDFTIAYNKDLVINGPIRALRVVGSAAKQAVELGVETVAMAHDTAVLGADAALRYTTGEGFENINLYSSIAENSAQRIAKGDSAGDIIKDSAFEIGANVVTVGTYGTFKQQFSLAADYLSGNVSSIEEVESRLIHAAGGAVLNAGLGAVGAKVAGEGWLGKPVSVPKPSVVLEGVSQLPGRARAAAGNVAARARSAYGQVKTVLQSEVQIQPQFNVASSFGAGSVKIKLIPPKSAGANRWSYRQAKGAAYDQWVNESYYGQVPAKKPYFRVDGKGRYLDNLVDDAGVRVGVENKYFRPKRGTQDVNVGVRKGTALRRDLAETLRRARGQARSHQRLLEQGVLDRFDWNLSGNYPKFQRWLEHLGLDANVRPMP